MLTKFYINLVERAILDFNYYKNTIFIPLLVVGTIIFILFMILYLYRSKSNKKIVVLSTTTLYIFFTFISIYLTYPLILGDYYFSNGFYKDALPHYLELNSRVENYKFFDIFYKEILKIDISKYYKKRLIISYYGAEHYDKAKDQLLKLIPLLPPKKQIFIYLYISHTSAETGDILKAKSLFFKSHLMAYHYLKGKNLERYLETVEMIPIFKDIVPDFVGDLVMEIDQILNSVKDIAVIGVSKSPYKAAHTVPKYMLENGYNIIPINPTADKIFDIDCYNNIFDVEENIDMVNIFRPSNEIESIVKDIIKRGKKILKLYGFNRVFLVMRGEF